MGFFAQAQADITFCVDVDCVPVNNTVEIFGTFTGFFSFREPLSDPDGDNIYCTTLTVAAGRQEYKFLVDGWEEPFKAFGLADPSCTVTFNPFVNRFIDVVDGVNQTVTFGFASCDANCAAKAYEVCVDASCQNPNFVTIFGTYNGFQPDRDVMSDPDGDGTFCRDVIFPTGELEYLFRVNGVNESLDPGTPCTKTSFGNTNRVIDVPVGDPSQPTEQILFGFGSCDEDCFNPAGANIEFCVDVTNTNPNPGIVELAGTFTNNFANRIELFDPEGDGTYCTTVFLNPGFYEYKFIIDGAFEDFGPDAGCTAVVNPPFRNRVLSVFAGINQNLIFDYNSCTSANASAQSTFCERVVRHFGDNPESEVRMTIANIDANTIYVEVESTGSDPVDNLAFDYPPGFVRPDESPLNTTIPGKVSKTLTWPNNPPFFVDFNILWSQEANPGGGAGNWQLLQPFNYLRVQLDAVCANLTPPPPPPPATFCSERILHFGNDPNSEIFLTVATSSNNSFFVEIESTNNDPVDLLLVQGAAGAQVSGEFEPRPGVIRRTLTYPNGAPDVADIQVLWSKESFGGNWSLNPGAGTRAVDTQGVCPPPVPTMGEWGIFLLGLIVLILGTVFMLQFQTASQLRTAGSTNATMSFNASNMPFNRSVFMSALKATLWLVPLGFAFIYVCWGEIVVHDFFGMFLTIPLVAYLIHLLKK